VVFDAQARSTTPKSFDVAAARTRYVSFLPKASPRITIEAAGERILERPVPGCPLRSPRQEHRH
jgi:hypothetical protein